MLCVHVPDCFFAVFGGFLHIAFIMIFGPGSSVGIANDYGLDGPGSNPCGDEIFHTCPDWPWGPPSLLYNGYWLFPGVKVRPGACC